MILDFDDVEIKNFSNSEKIIKKARLFYAGKHKGQEYNEADIDKMISNFPADGVPIQLDHSEKAKDTVGISKKVFKKGGELWGELEFVGSETVDKIKNGLWKKLSVGLAMNKDNYRVREISVTPFPALPQAQIFSESVIYFGGEKMGNENQEKSEKMVENQEKTVSFAEFEKMKHEFTEKLEEEQKMREEAFKKLQFEEDKQVIVKFVESGKTTPAMKENELKLFNSLDAEQKKLFLEVKKNQPAFYELGKVYNTAEAKKISGEEDEKQVKMKAEEIAKYFSYSTPKK